jgi:hypothetical protein
MVVVVETSVVSVVHRQSSLLGPPNHHSASKLKPRHDSGRRNFEPEVSRSSATEKAMAPFDLMQSLTGSNKTSYWYWQTVPTFSGSKRYRHITTGTDSKRFECFENNLRATLLNTVEMPRYPRDAVQCSSKLMKCQAPRVQQLQVAKC